MNRWAATALARTIQFVYANTVMDASPAAPPIIAPPRSITYELTRGDLFATLMTLLLRSRILQIFVPIALLFNLWILFSRAPRDQAPSHLIAGFVVSILGFLGVLVFTQLFVALLAAFVQNQTGVVCRHTIEITEQGLIERTDVNETLYKWGGILRVFSLFGYLYIYVGANNSFPIPRGDFPPGELEAFETELRQRIAQARGVR
jgi:hypothetical protein